jgi:hypothetical protein
MAGLSGAHSGHTGGGTTTGWRCQARHAFGVRRLKRPPYPFLQHYLLAPILSTISLFYMLECELVICFCILIALYDHPRHGRSILCPLPGPPKAHRPDNVLCYNMAPVAARCCSHPFPAQISNACQQCISNLKASARDRRHYTEIRSLSSQEWKHETSIAFAV